jgi:S1-C subfamily serine protease
VKKFSFLIFACLFVVSCYGQAIQRKTPVPTSSKRLKTLTELINVVRPSVVQIAVKVSGGHPPKEYAGCFQGPLCVVGTGFFVNSSGYVVTAFHVMEGYDSKDKDGKVIAQHPGVKEVIAAAEQSGTHAQLIIGVAFPNAETSAITISSDIKGFPAKTIATDPSHDLAVIQATGDPFSDMDKAVSGTQTAGIPKSKAGFVTFSTSRPSDGEEVFALGYPFFSFSPVSTSGKVASAWNFRTLIRAQAAGFSEAVEVYELDLGINPGNSGGPIFKSSDQSVLGVGVEAIGSLGVAVPAKFVTQLLDANKITWHSAQVK